MTFPMCLQHTNLSYTHTKTEAPTAATLRLGCDYIEVKYAYHYGPKAWGGPEHDTGSKSYTENVEKKRFYSILVDFGPMPYLGEVGGSTKIKFCRQYWVYNKYSYICQDKSWHMYKYLLLRHTACKGRVICRQPTTQITRRLGQPG